MANLFTLFNILSGAIGIIYALNGDIISSLRMMMLGEAFDLFDGQLAKKSKYKGNFGFYADSVADLVTFVILPAYMALQVDLLWNNTMLPIVNITYNHLWVALFSIGGWGRLIRYAAGPTGSQFKGLPTAAASMLIGSLLVFADYTKENPLPLTEEVLTIVLLVLGILMISNIVYPSPKRMFKSDNILINVAIVVGASFLFIPCLITVIALLFISVLYTAAGPFYYLTTEKLIQKDGLKPS